MKSSYSGKVILFLAGIMSAPLALSGTTIGISKSIYGDGGAGGSYDPPSINADGQVVVFSYITGDLVSGDTNDNIDIFAYDRATDSIERVSVSTSGEQSNGDSYTPSVSGDGRYVVFTSAADNLTPGATGGYLNVYLHDRETGETRRLSQGLAGASANGDSTDPSISDDGQFIAFASKATNLVASDINGEEDIFVYEFATNSISIASLTSDGEQLMRNDYWTNNPKISADGRFVAFDSHASDLIPGDTNGAVDVFVRDRQLGETRRVSESTTGVQANQSSTVMGISADGRYIIFRSFTDNFTKGDTTDPDFFVHDMLTLETKQITYNDSDYFTIDATNADISADGQYAIFVNNATDLVPEELIQFEHVFYRDLETGATQLASVSSAGEPASNGAYYAALSGDGKYVVFSSISPNLDESFNNYRENFFLHEVDPFSGSESPNMGIDVSINGVPTENKFGAILEVGLPYPWVITVYNWGDETAPDVKLFTKGVQPERDDAWAKVCQLGDIVGHSKATCEVDTLAIAGQFQMLVSAQSQLENGNKVVAGTTAWYQGVSVGIAPSISIDVLLNGEDSDNNAPGFEFATGETITYTYSVKNTGQYEFADIQVYDRYHPGVNGGVTNTSWSRACIWTKLLPSQVKTCTREVEVETGEFRRDISVQTLFGGGPTKIVDDEYSYFIGVNSEVK